MKGGKSAGHISLDPQEFKDKDSKYLCVELNPQKVEAEVLKYFLNSEYGLILRKKIAGGESGWRCKPKNIKELMLPIPPDKVVRNEIVDGMRRVAEVEGCIEMVKSKMVLDPDSIDVVLQHIKNLHEASRRTDVKARILHWLSSDVIDESHQLEFKATLSLDREEWNKNYGVENAVLKTIAAFVNTNGGNLVIGIEDGSKKVLGIEDEASKLFSEEKEENQVDKFVQKLSSWICDKIKPNIAELAIILPVKIEQQTVLLVECSRANVAAVMTEKESGNAKNARKRFYIRTNNSSRALKGEEIVQFCERNNLLPPENYEELV